MIIVGNKKPKIINPEYIEHFELRKGKVSAYVSGDNDGDTITVTDISVREPWTVVVRTTVDTYYVNLSSFDDALEYLTGVCTRILDGFDVEKFTKDIRRIYGKETNKKS